LDDLLLTILYGVLILAVLVVGGLLAVVLWQTSLAISQARSVFIPQIQQVLTEVQQNLKNTEDITADLDGKLSKLDGAITAANSAVKSISQTTLLLNKAVAQPAIVNAAALLSGVKSAAAHLRDHRGDRQPKETREVRTELEAERISR
jgi:uncharacterized protein YoxC